MTPSSWVWNACTRIAGTVFEGVPHLLPQPAASSLGAVFAHGAVEEQPTTYAASISHAARAGNGVTDAATVEASDATAGRYRPWTALRSACCGFADRCDIVRQWTAWLGAARAGLAS